ncbi:MAG: DUF2961 domain-containing protein, partial [Deltaproteobacteria bacterium]|nr:DUF2961 domain-containing protein [Deltaproteobacteria bacterium]
YRYRGQGTIEGIRFSPHGALLPEHLSRGRIRITWDDATHPAVDAPLGLFFGSGLGEAHINALAFSMRPGGPYENRIPMPFWRGFKIAVDGVKGTIEIAIGPKRFLRRNAGSLHARAFTAAHPRRGEDIVILDVTGEGKLIGTVLAVHPSPHVKRWWEGDLHSYVDGRRTPGIHGTGVEDDHLAGWSNTLFAHPFSLPLHGEPQSHIIEANGLQHNAEISLYRLWPGIPFSQHLRHSFEHGNENTVDARYRGLAFFYLRQPQRPALVEADRLVLANAASRRAHDLHVAGTKTLIRMKSSFEGEDADWPFSAQTLVHRGSATFTFHLPPKNRGCWLRRLYDQEQGRQRARLLVDGHYLRDWYIAEGNATCAWAERGLFLPASITAGRKAITLTLEPRPDAPPWNAAIYRILCLRDVDDS